jgi:hypothetical protein
MSRPSVATLSTVGLLLALVLGGAAWMGLFRHHTTPAELDALFRERIPIGSSNARVEMFLNSAGVDHAYLPRERTTNALWSRTWIGLVGEGAIQARFYFDEKQRLVDYQLSEVSTYL